MTLRDLSIGIAANVTPLQKLQKEMGNVTDSTSDSQKTMEDWSRTVNHAHQRTIKSSESVTDQFGSQSEMMRQLAKTSGVSARQMSRDWSSMSTEMQKSMIKNHNEMKKYRSQVLDVENDMRKLSSQMGNYTGTTNDFMGEVRKLGKTHKKATDQMINNNVAMRKGLVQTVATMSAMSGQSEKISKNYDEMDQAIYKVNKPLLKVTGGLERMAREGNAAFIALEQLGPNASMKALQDRIMLINRGIMRQQMVVMAAAVAWVGFTAIMANAALGPDVEKNLAAQSEAIAEYEKELKKRTEEISNTWSIFEDIQLEATKPDQLMKNMKEQVKTLENWQKNLITLDERTPNEWFIKHLRKMGPEAAGHIRNLTKMTSKEFNNYVLEWEKREAAVRGAAETELEGLRRKTERQVKALQNSLTPLGLAVEEFKQTWAEALGPFVQFWGGFATLVVKAGTKVGEFVQKLNDISPWITKLGGMFLYLVTTFTLLLSPLAIGIGYIMGLRAAFAAAWMFIGPLVTGLGAMMGTVLLVSAAVIGFGAALYLLWTRSETFRSGVISGWETIRQKGIEVWGFIKQYMNQAISVIVAFGQKKLAELTVFWQNNGQMIMEAFQNIGSFLSKVMSGIWSVMKFVWPAVLAIIKMVWSNIKGVINGALNVIMGAVKIFAGLFTGNFGKMWEGIKQLFTGAVQFVWNFVQLTLYGRLLKGAATFVLAFRTAFSTLWKSIIKAVIGFGRGFIALLQGNFTRAIRLFTVSWGRLKQGTVSALKGIWGAVSSTFTSIWTFMKNIWASIRSLTTGAINAVKFVFTGGLSSMFKATKSGLGKVRKWFADIFLEIFVSVSNRFNNIVKLAKELPGKIGKGIGSMASAVKGGITKVINSMARTLGKGINGVILGINWVMDKIGIDFSVPEWDVPEYANGTKGHPGGPAILGDGGMNELYKTPQGQMGLSPATDTLMNLPRGTEVLSGPETQKVFNNYVPAYESGNVITNAVKTGVSWVKDKALDVWSYVSSPGKLVTKLFEKYNVNFPSSFGGAFGKLGTGTLSVVKDNVVEFMKNKLSNIGSMFSGGGKVSGNVTQWIQAAMAATGVPGSWLGPLQTIAMKESGGNPRAQNNWDINAKRGIPSKGLMQTIGPTFNANKLPGMNNILNPVHNAAAAIRYIQGRYGNVFNVPGIKSMARGGAYRGYANGTNGPLQRSEWAWVGERGPELMHLQKGTEIFSNKESTDMTSGGYTPSSSDGGMVYSPNFSLTVEAGAKVDDEMIAKLKEMFRELSEEQFESLLRRMGFNREG